MKFFLLLIGLIEGISSDIYGQKTNIDSLISRIEKSPNDTAALERILQYSFEVAFYDPTSALRLNLKVIDETRQMHYPKIEAEALNLYAEDYHYLGNYADALKMQFEALQINRHLKDLSGEGVTLGLIGILYNELAEYRQALGYLIPADSIYQGIPGTYGCFVLANIGDAYDSLHMTDSALYYIRKSYFKFADKDQPHILSFVLLHMGSIYAQFGQNDSALYFYNRAVSNSRISNDRLSMGMSLNKIAQLYSTRGMYDSGIYFAQQAFRTAQSIPSKLHVLNASNLLVDLYDKVHEPDSILYYLKTVQAMKDSLHGPDKYHKLQVLLLDEQQRQNLVRQQEQEFRNRIKYILLIAGLVIFSLLAFILMRAYRLKQKANILLHQQKIKIEETLTELRSTQSQLIQSEKMASIGELTAGIAHEIQNPLNFMNNFSEVNAELIEEMKEEFKTGNQKDVLLIADNIAENERKIIHHGKRADAIVKGMLQHSRSSTGAKEPTNVNALADEYLRLSYHGLRAREKSFNAVMKTDYDQATGNINIIPQSIGRVLLNLYNNAFYAVSEKKKQLGNGYEPTVSVSTKKLNGKVEIRVKDNGNGIPQKVLNKIFQPFFTTKPAGQGTGLGLSLSYDIIKAHGGEIKAETEEGKFTEFVIQIPMV